MSTVVCHWIYMCMQNIIIQSDIHTCVVVCAIHRDMDISIKFTNEKIHLSLALCIFTRSKRKQIHRINVFIFYMFHCFSPLLFSLALSLLSKLDAGCGVHVCAFNQLYANTIYSFDRSFLNLHLLEWMLRNVSNEQKITDISKYAWYVS